MELVTAAEMRALDRAAIDERNIPAIRLMENAGKAVVDEMERQFGSLRKKRVTVVAGKGQNGGDGFVAARLLKQRMAILHMTVLGSPTALKDAAAVSFKRFTAKGGRCHAITRESDVRDILVPFVEKADYIVDAIFGTGLNAPIEGPAATAIAAMNESGRPIIAVDLPSGLNSDTGKVMGTAVKAALTVTLARPKRGLYLGLGPDYAGVIRVADIGIPDDAVAAAKIPLALLDRSYVQPFLRARPRAAHKGTFGHAGIIAGSVGKTGAAAMAATAALRTGAGLVTVATPASINDVLEGKLLEAMTFPVSETAARTLSLQAHEHLLTFAMDKTAVAIGPGIGRHPETVKLVHQLVATLERPFVLDADALNAVAERRDVLHSAKAAIIVTPHPGEMARLMGLTTANVQKERLVVACRLAQEENVYVVLKGAGTIVAAPDGRMAINSTGNPGLATAGTGDVLTGMIAGLLAQGLSPWEAACLATYLHGLAGDLATCRVGQVGLIAGDVMRSIPEAIAQIVGPSPHR